MSQSNDTSTPGEQSREWLIDMLYGELGDDSASNAEDQLRGDATLLEEYQSLDRVRAMMRALPGEEPPATVTAKLLHAAALHAHAPTSSASRARADEGEQRGVWAWLSSWFRPIVMYPGLAAAASLVLVAGVAGALYMTGRGGVHEQVIAKDETAAGVVPVTAQKPLATPSAEPVLPEPEATAQEASDPGDQPSGSPDGDAPAEIPAATRFESQLKGNGSRRNAETGTLGLREEAKKNRRVARIAYDADDGASFADKPASGEAPEPPGNQALQKKAGDSIPIAREGAPPLKPIPDEGRIPAPSTDRSRTKAPARKPSSAPAVEAEKNDEIGEPEPTRAPAKDLAQDKAGADASRDRTARVVSLHSEARDAARAGDCKSARNIAEKVRALDSSYYKAKVAGDKILARCLVPTKR